MGKKRKQSKFEKSGVVTELSEVSKGQIAQETESAKKQPSARDDIDDIFSAVKKLPTVEKDHDKCKVTSKLQGNVEDIFGNNAGTKRKRTEEGFPIYNEEELKLNKGGDTDLCPFDCDCCF
uniref:DUF1764-domain-containing protein n=1 Tax=Tetraselmis sp. GSL018 TaxID=582737 RepID=A0A061RCL0_9CHLO|mmetsp:Transcript_18106/g.43341  ORF Transcript_18106/g.43341 Transcript_18106/m.43341 type:complete len:121 (-) Transcript_18106:391-753(-)